MSKKLSPAQRRHQAIGPNFKKFYLDDGMTYGAGCIIQGFRALDGISETRKQRAAGMISRKQARISALSFKIDAKRWIGIARARCPIPA